MSIRVTPLLRKLFPFFLLLRGNGICYGSKYFITAIVKATTVATNQLYRSNAFTLSFQDQKLAKYIMGT